MKNKPENEIWTNRFLLTAIVFFIITIALGGLIRFLEFNQTIQSILEMVAIGTVILCILSLAIYEWLNLSWGGGKEFKKFLIWSLVGAVGIIIVALSIAWHTPLHKLLNLHPYFNYNIQLDYLSIFLDYKFIGYPINV